MDAPPTGLIHIHEDEWGMRSLHPRDARDEVCVDLGESDEAAERNRDPSGFGWTDIHVIATPSVDFRDLVGLDAFCTKLAPVMPAVTRFYATVGSSRGDGGRDPLGSYDEAATCFGFDPACYIKADIIDGAVAAIWFECRTPDVFRRDALMSGLRALDVLTPCHLVNYWLHVDGSVGDDAFLRRYADLLLAKAR